MNGDVGHGRSRANPDPVFLAGSGEEALQAFAVLVGPQDKTSRLEFFSLRLKGLLRYLDLEVFLLEQERSDLTVRVVIDDKGPGCARALPTDRLPFSQKFSMNRVAFAATMFIPTRMALSWRFTLFLIDHKVLASGGFGRYQSRPPWR